VVDRDYRRAHEAVVAAIEAANAATPGAGHIYDTSPQLGWQLTAADVAVTDVSAMIYDRLATGKPLLVTRPSSAEADVDERGYLGAAEWLDAVEADDVVDVVDRVRDDPEARRRLEHWVRRYFGDTTPGAATERFEAAVRKLVELRDEHARRDEARRDEAPGGTAFP